MTSSHWVSLLATILDRTQWNSKPPSLPNQGWSRAKGKTCHFPIFVLRGGRGRWSKFSSYFFPLAEFFRASFRKCIVFVFNCGNLLYICYMNPYQEFNLNHFSNAYLFFFQSVTRLFTKIKLQQWAFYSASLEMVSENGVFDSAA